MPKASWKWARLYWLLLSLGIIILDQLSKWLAYDQLKAMSPKVVIPGFFNWYLGFNKGAAFGLLGTQGGWQIIFLAVLACVICLLLLVWLLRSSWLTPISQLAIAFIIGGAIGNVIDRVRIGHVIDFIQLHYHDYFWPTFNVADTFVCIGAAIIIYMSLTRSSDEQHTK